MDTEKKPKITFSGKMCVRLNALFSRKYRFYFRSETEKRTSGASGTAKRRSNACKAGGRSVAKAGKAAAENERSERRAEGGERKRDDRAKGERAERASIYRPSAVASNSAVEKCSLFVVSSPLLGGSNAPHWRRHGKEAERNGGRTAFCLSFVHEYGDYF